MCVCETFKKNYIHCIFVNFSENWRSLMLRYAHNYELLYLHTHTHTHTHTQHLHSAGIIHRVSLQIHIPYILHITIIIL